VWFLKYPMTMNEAEGVFLIYFFLSLDHISCILLPCLAWVGSKPTVLLNSLHYFQCRSQKGINHCIILLKDPGFNWLQIRCAFYNSMQCCNAFLHCWPVDPNFAPNPALTLMMSCQHFIKAWSEWLL
jgi:hypothetical protein